MNLQSFFAQILATIGFYHSDKPFSLNIIQPVTDGPYGTGGPDGPIYPLFTTSTADYGGDLVTQYQTKCGLPANMTRMSGTRIVGGVDVSISDYPWQVSLQRWSPIFGSTHFCGGSLIHPKWVMTAAHCLEWAFNGETRKAMTGELRRVRVIAGSETIAPPATNSLTLRITDAILHPQYESRRGLNDIALIALEKPVRVLARGLAINTVCLPTDKNMVINKRLITTGWGTTQENGDDSIDLKAVELPLVPAKQCKEMYGRGFSPELEICAGSEGKDSCQGDSGGPLIQRDRTGRATVVGIVSTGNGCGRPGYPGLYTKVPAFIDWIRNIIN